MAFLDQELLDIQRSEYEHSVEDSLI